MRTQAHQLPSLRPRNEREVAEIAQRSWMVRPQRMMKSNTSVGRDGITNTVFVAKKKGDFVSLAVEDVPVLSSLAILILLALHCLSLACLVLPWSFAFALSCRSACVFVHP